MKELIARLERALEGSRQLDQLIYTAIDAPGLRESRDGEIVASPNIYSIQAPEYSTSLDAAFELMPRQFSWTLNSTIRFGCAAIIRGHQTHEGDAATPALAICIAALKARSES